MTDDRKDQDSHCKHPVHAAVNKQILFMVYKALLPLVAVLIVAVVINPKWRQVPHYGTFGDLYGKLTILRRIVMLS